MTPQFKLFVAIKPHEIVFRCKGRLDASAACLTIIKLYYEL
jgi:hypothetical protein